ncbi:MAG: LacI family DNA-binding transcriptional regulator [Pseudomonadota bacterium]
MRPTTKDLAKHAGVSRATVDRVLNGRAGVHDKTIRAVNKAIEELGFVRNLSAANLAKRRIYRFAFLLPQSRNAFLETLIAQIDDLKSAVRADGIEISCRHVLERDPHRVVETLAALSTEELDGIAIMAPESPQVRDAIQRLIERGVRVVRFLSGRPGKREAEFVGIDNQAAGATAARLLGGFCRRNSGRVLIVAESMNAFDSAQRRLGFDRTLAARFPGLTALPTLETHGDAARADEIIRNSYDNFPGIVGVYVMSSDAVVPLDAVCRFGEPANQVIVAHERTRLTLSLLANDTIDALITQNPGHVVRSAVRLLKSQCDGRPPLASQEDIRIEILLKENVIDRAATA